MLYIDQNAASRGLGVGTNVLSHGYTYAKLF